jgi:sarcosine oxidase, subunit beta
MAAPDVLVIGAGITGAAAALALAEAGARVEVIDRWGPAAMASGWTLAGVRQSGRDPAELPLALAAVAQWPGLAERLGAETHYRQQGNLRLARTEAEVPVIRALVDSQRAAGLDLRYLHGNDAVRAMAPALSRDILAASLCPTDGHADPVATVAAFLGAARRASAVLSMGETVSRLETAGGRVTGAVTPSRRIAAGAVILAGGVMVNDLLGPLGLAIPLRLPMVTVIRTAPLPPMIAQVLGVANADMALRQEVTGHLRLTSGAEDWSGAIEEEAGRPLARPALGRVAETVARVGAVLPALREAGLSAVWGGVLDLTPDALPVIDRAPGLDNLVLAAGFSGHGFGIGPVTGPLAADLALGRAPAHPLDAFRWDRFGAAGMAPLTLHG